MSKIRKLRDTSFCSQNGRCHYCDAPMWRRAPADFAKKYGITESSARIFKATAEHLKPRREGGRNDATNIVAACLFCNCHRHRTRTALPPEKFKVKVRKRLATGRWHGLRSI